MKKNYTHDNIIYIDDTLYFPTEEEIYKDLEEMAHKRGFTLEEVLLCLDNSIFREQEQKQFVEKLRKERNNHTV